jgi:hypothetical protein
MSEGVSAKTNLTDHRSRPSRNKNADGRLSTKATKLDDKRFWIVW